MIRRKIAMGLFWAGLAVALHLWPMAPGAHAQAPNALRPRPWLRALFLVFLFSLGGVGRVAGQGSRKDDIVFNSRGVPLAGATVRVCVMPASGQPCTPLAQIFSDAALTQALANPTTTDGLGNYFFYAAPGKYEIELSGAGIITKQIPNVILPSDPTSPSFSSVTSSGAISAFSLNLTGNLTVNGNTTVAGNLAATAGANSVNTVQLNGCQMISASQSFASALAAVGSSGCIQVLPGPYTVSSPATIPSTVGLQYVKGGVLNVNCGSSGCLAINSPIYASPDAQIFAYGTGTVALGGPNAVLSTAWFPGADFCAQTNAAMIALQAGGGAAKGGFFDGRHYTASQTCATNPFVNVTMPLVLYIPYASTSFTNELAQWQHSAGNQFVIAYPGTNPAQLIAGAGWPSISVTSVTVTSNVAAVVLASALTRAPAAGQTWCIFGTSDRSVEGCVFVLASPAPTTTTFSYNVTISNRTATGGNASPPMISIGTATSGSEEAVRYDGVTINGNGLAGTIIANIAGQEGSGVGSPSFPTILNNFTQRGIFIGGPAKSSGSGNHAYQNLHILFNSGAAGCTGIEANTLGNNSRIHISDVTIVSNGSGTCTNGILAYNSSIDTHATHVENFTNAINCTNNSMCTGDESTVSGSTVAHNLVGDAAGNIFSYRTVVSGSSDAVNNAQTGTALTGIQALYVSTSNGAEQWMKDDATKAINMTNLRTAAVAFASLPTCNAAAEGTRAAVNNSNTAVFQAVIAGGGANHVAAYCNGTSWLVD